MAGSKHNICHAKKGGISQKKNEVLSVYGRKQSFSETLLLELRQGKAAISQFLKETR
jgi:hypothetical protein